MKVSATCPCGKVFDTTEARVGGGRGKYCSKVCMYAYHPRRSGLTYQIRVQNRAWFERGQQPWNAGLTGMPATSGAIRPGEHRSPSTEFRPGQQSWNAGTRGVMPSGEDHHAWGGDSVAYSTVHNWIAAHRQKPSRCDECGAERPLDWSNVSGEYHRDLSDWRALCRKCHFRYDRAFIPGASVRKREQRSCAR